MNGTAWTRGRFALVAAAMVVAAALVLPTAASAKEATKIVVTREVQLDYSVPGVVPATPTVTAKLYHKHDGKWSVLTGRVKCYFYDWATYDRRLVVSAMGPRVTVALGGRGFYEWEYKGTSKYKASNAFTSRTDIIGPAVPAPDISIASVDETYSLVTVAYDLTWNTDAFAGPLVFHHNSFFSEVDDPESPSYEASGQVVFMRVVSKPQTVLFSYRVRTDEMLPVLHTFGGASPSGTGFRLAGPYSVESSITVR